MIKFWKRKNFNNCNINLLCYLYFLLSIIIIIKIDIIKKKTYNTNIETNLK